MMYHGNKLPKVKIEISDLVKKGDRPSVDAAVKEFKPNLDKYLLDMLDRSGTDLGVYWTEIFKVTATFCDWYTPPVLMISGLAAHLAECDLVFVEAFAMDGDDTAPTIANIYRR